MGSEPDRENSRDGGDEDSDNDIEDSSSPGNTHSARDTPNGAYVVSTSQVVRVFYLIYLLGTKGRPHQGQKTQMGLRHFHITNHGDKSVCSVKQVAKYWDDENTLINQCAFWRFPVCRHYFLSVSLKKTVFYPIDIISGFNDWTR